MAEKNGDLNVTPDELDRIKKAFKKEEFRKLFREYAEEIADPENRKRYEEEIRQLEMERGMDVDFVHPEPGYVMKTSDGNVKTFVNVCQNDKIQKPSSKKQVNPDGTAGLMWSIPHSFSPVREDFDAEKNKCKVYDVVFHPDTYRLAESNIKFKGIVHDTIFDGIQQKFNDKLDRKNFKILKNLKFKGTPSATVIRNKVGEPSKKSADDIMNKFPYPYGDQTTAEKSKQHDKKMEEEAKKETKNKLISEIPSQDPESKSTTPVYKITHRTNMDMADFAGNDTSKPDRRPSELVIVIELPLIKKASNVDLDIFEKKLVLTSETPAKYDLNINLPYPVDENNGSAKFDKTKHKLTVTLPVLPGTTKAVKNGSESLESSHENLNGIVSNGASEETSMKTDEPGNSSPLIQVLSSSMDNQTTGSNKNNINETNIENIANSELVSETIPPAIPTPGTTTKSIWNDNDFGALPTEETVRYSEPKYEFFQDNKTVTVILQVKRVNKNTVTKMFSSSNNNGVHIKFASLGSGGFPAHYSLVMEFPSDCVVDREKTSVDVSRDNVVLLVSKAKEARGLWSGFKAGSDASKLQERLFLTEYAVTCDLADLEAEYNNTSSAMPSKDSPNADLHVSEMNNNKLTIQIKDKEASSRASCSSESSNDIEVVFSEDRPKLHGILKQRSRTLSESSEEPLSASWGREAFSYSRENSLSAYGSESTSAISEGEEGDHRARKSVSFNTYVDRTHYKTNTPISTLHNTLKNKKKRAKKREQHKSSVEERRRRRSSSSGSYSDSVSDPEDAHSTNDEHEEGEPEVNEDAPQPAPAAEVSTKPEEKEEGTASKKKNKKRSRKNKQRSAAAASGHSPLETSKTPATAADDSSASDIPASPSSSEDALSPRACPAPLDTPPLPAPGKKSPVVLLPNNEADSDDEEIPPTNSVQPNGKSEKHDNTIDVPSEKPPANKGQKKATGDKKGAQPAELDSQAAPDTMLRWDEGPKRPEVENVTKCAFNFKNNVMFELDED